EPADHCAVAVAEADVAQRDATVYLLQRHRLRGSRHRRYVVEDVEDTLGAGRRLLRDRHDAAHRIEPRVKAADVGEEGSQHADRDAAARDLPYAEGPHHEQADL